MSSSRSLLPVPLVAFIIAAAFVGYEYTHGGVRTHHFLARSDLPGFSNWLSLVVLPALAGVLALRLRALHDAGTSRTVLRGVTAGGAGAFVYGASLAASFLLGFPQASTALFGGLFVLALALPVYRVEYIAGFVLGMTIAFGSVIPLVFALVFAVLSVTTRGAGMFVIAAMRRQRA